MNDNIKAAYIIVLTRRNPRSKDGEYGTKALLQDMQHTADTYGMIVIEN